MINFQKMQIESIGPLIVLGLMLLVVIGVVKIILGVMLTIGLDKVFGQISVADTILFLILLINVRHYMYVACEAKTTKSTTTAKKK
ncbi:MAG: hypothetical protein PQ612_00095 [Rickettsiales bacterium]|nr:hypothetical protein [Pseudomonadota bacterium]MDA0965684.1 hypothetical protein [Pseudomonadota bacterium]MDG4543008.1 hypothetical protein [Rickettsiales bacterium]MDG4544544.1 hypothetical protein [Rickettsiales bacterium]MDG4546666.1 hypothetical protein [Rickettsiales bacterium]